MINKKCVQCGKEFTLTDSELEFYQSRNLSIPKRCRECRNLNKNQRDKKNNLPDRKKSTHNGRRKLPVKFFLMLLCTVILVIWGLNRYIDLQTPNSEDSQKNNYTSLSLVNDDKVLSQDNDDTASSQDKYETITNQDSSNKTISKNDENKLLSQDNDDKSQSQEVKLYTFRSEEYTEEHFEKHGKDLGYNSVEEYVEGANRVINSTESLHKLEKEDGDDIYYLQSTNEFVVLSKDGFIRSYFKPEDGIDYYNRQ